MEVKKSQFFAVLSRMKYINRWGLMRNTRPENLSEHSFDVAVIAHALCEIANSRFGGGLDSGRAALLSLYHDSAEIFTGDMPTPVKYFSPAIREAYRKVEGMSVSRLLSYLPQDLMPSYESLLRPEGEDEHIIGIIKAADKLSALIKCIEEGKAGNSEFKSAAAAQETYLRGLKMPEVDCFMNEFLPAFSLSLDEQE
jgi:5'-deoxynucleotidase